MTELRVPMRRLMRGIAVLVGVLVTAYVIFVLTPWGQQVDNAAYRGHRAMPHNLRRHVSDIMGLVQVSTIAVVAICLVAVAALRGRVWVGLMVGAAWAGAIGIAELSKWALPRPLLVAHHKVYLLSQSYPSGHVTVATSAALALVLLAPARWRQWAATGAGFVTATYGAGVVFSGMHRPSDALGSIALSTASMSAVALLVMRRWGRRIENAPLRRAPIATSGILAVVLATISVAIAYLRPANQTHSVETFLACVACISAAAFSAAAWFGAQLRQFDWSPTK